MSPVDGYFRRYHRDADALAKLTYEGDKPVTENPEEFERFAYYVQQAEVNGILETPSGRYLDGEFEGDWIEVQSLLIEGERRLLGFVPVLTDNIQRLHKYEERLQEGSKQPPSQSTVGFPSTSRIVCPSDTMKFMYAYCVLWLL